MVDKPQVKDADIDQRQRILDAATKVLADGGAEALRVRDIAALADCSTMGVYSYFGGKNGLVEAIFVDGFQRLEVFVRQTEHAPEQTRYQRMSLAYRDWAFANPGAYEVMFAGAVPGFSPSDDALDAARNAFGVVIDVVAFEQAAGRITHTDTYLVAHTLWALVHGLVMVELAGMTPGDTSGARDDSFFLAAMIAGAKGFS